METRKVAFFFRSVLDRKPPPTPLLIEFSLLLSWLLFALVLSRRIHVFSRPLLILLL